MLTGVSGAGAKGHCVVGRPVTRKKKKKRREKNDVAMSVLDGDSNISSTIYYLDIYGKILMNISQIQVQPPNIK